MIYLKRKPRYYFKYLDRYLKRLVLPFFPSHRPEVMIIGAQKSATTSLYNYLNQFPGMAGSRNKEIYYFDREVNYGKSLTWYHNYFKGLSTPKKIYFEATPNYLYFPWVAERLYQYNPDLKLIAVIREPIARAYSAWNMYKDFFKRGELYRVQRGLWPGQKNYHFEYLYKDRDQFPSFEECVDIEMELSEKHPDIHEPALLRRGLYYEQLSRYLQYFKQDQIRVVGYTELANNSDQTTADLYQWISGKDSSNTILKTEKRNSRNYKMEISDSLKSRLDDYYHASNEKLRALLGREIPW